MHCICITQNYVQKYIIKMKLQNEIKKKMLSDNIFLLKLSIHLNKSQPHVRDSINKERKLIRLFETVNFIKEYYNVGEEEIFVTDTSKEKKIY